MSRLRWASRHSVAVRYSFAIASALAALLLRLLFAPLFGFKVPYITFFVAATGSAGFGGTIPGLVTVVLGAIFASAFLFDTPGGFQLTDPVDPYSFIRYMAAGTVICIITGGFARSRERAKVAETSERQARLFSEQTLAAISDAVISTDTGQRVQFINEAASRLTGWNADEARGLPLKTVFRLVDDAGAEVSTDLVAQAIGQRQVARPEGYAILATRDGRKIITEPVASPIQDQDGTVVGSVLVFRDVSERRAAEEKRRTNEARLELAVQSTRMVVWEWDPLSDRLMTTGNVEEIYGSALETAEQFFGILHADDAEVQRARWRTAAASGGSSRSVYRVVRPDSGKGVWIEETAASIADASGAVVRVVGVAVDVTERKRSERILQETVQIYRAIGESIPFGVWICDADGENTYASDSFLKLVGMTQAECSAYGWGNVLHPDDAQRTIEAWKECVRTGDVWYIEHRFKGVDGRFHPILARGVPVRDAMGRTICWAGINLDISRLKEVEAALRSQAEELRRSNRELEQFAFVASHDLQEPLRMVNAYTELLLRRIGDRRTPELDQYASFIEQAVRKMERLIRDLLSFSRVIHGEVERKPVDTNAAVAHALHSCRRVIAESSAEVVVDDLPWVMADEGQLAQLFVNLITNAVKYQQPAAPPRIHVRASTNGSEATFQVGDNGIGFEPRYSEMIFRLFKRLHGSEYPGTGLGLAICQRIVERYGGRIWAESEPGEGSTFFFTLPLSTAQQTRGQAAQ